MSWPAPGEWAALARKVVAGYVSYAFHRAGEVTETIAGIDDIMGFGFNWAPPSVLVDTIGLRETLAMIERVGLPVPARLADAAKAPTPGTTSPSALSATSSSAVPVVSAPARTSAFSAERMLPEP